MTQLDDERNGSKNNLFMKNLSLLNRFAFLSAVILTFELFAQSSSGENFYELKRQSISLSRQLKNAANGQLAIKSRPSGISYQLKGEISGQTDASHELRAGNYILVLRPSAKEKIIEKVEVIAGTETILHFDLSRMLKRKIEARYGVHNLLSQRDIHKVLKIEKYYADKKKKVLGRSKKKRLQTKDDYQKKIKKLRGRAKDQFVESYSQRIRKLEKLYLNYLKKINKAKKESIEKVLVTAKKRQSKKNKDITKLASYQPFFTIGARAGGGHASRINQVGPYTTSIEYELGMKLFSTGLSLGVGGSQVQILSGADSSVLYKRKLFFLTAKKDTTFLERFLSAQLSRQFILGLQTNLGIANYEILNGLQKKSVPYLSLGAYITGWNMLRIGLGFETTLTTLPLKFANDEYLAGIAGIIQIGYKL